MSNTERKKIIHYKRKSQSVVSDKDEMHGGCGIIARICFHIEYGNIMMTGGGGNEMRWEMKE